MINQIQIESHRKYFNLIVVICKKIKVHNINLLGSDLKVISASKPRFDQKCIIISYYIIQWKYFTKNCTVLVCTCLIEKV